MVQTPGTGGHPRKAVSKLAYLRGSVKRGQAPGLQTLDAINAYCGPSEHCEGDHFSGSEGSPVEIGEHKNRVHIMKLYLLISSFQGTETTILQVFLIYFQFYLTSVNTTQSEQVIHLAVISSQQRHSPMKE